MCVLRGILVGKSLVLNLHSLTGTVIKMFMKHIVQVYSYSGMM